MNDRIKPGVDLKPGAPKPSSPRVGAAMFRDLSGPMNPSGIMSAQYLMLLQALKNGSDPADVETALQHYMDSRADTGRAGANVPSIIQSSQTPDEAVRKLLVALKSGIKADLVPGQPDPLDSLPPGVKDTLSKAVVHIMGKHVAGLEDEIRAKTDNVASLRQRFALESADSVVESLLD